LTLLALIVMASAAVLNFRAFSSGKKSIEGARRNAAALQQIAQFRASVTKFQLLVEPAFTQASPAGAVANLAAASEIAQSMNTQSQTLVNTLAKWGLAPTAHRLNAANAVFAKSYTALAPLLAGVPGAKTAPLISAERAGYEAIVTQTAIAQEQVESSANAALRGGLVTLDDGRKTGSILVILAALATLSAGFVFGQRARRRELNERLNMQRQSFTTALQEALEMSQVETDVYGVVREALDQSLPQLQVEMLVADSSRAHFHRALATGDPTGEQPQGCGVASPLDCPSTIRGHTLVFDSSRALNACPYLKDRPGGACSAACVPISIAGKTVGVTHAVGPDNAPPDRAAVQYLEITSRRASERIAMLRAFEKSETQARSDPLTGLSNRRSLENGVRDLQQKGVPYGLAYGDLDHFKLLNDTHGHEAGDQALRLFSRVLRDSIRPTDIASRYGGEEFVLVLPGADTETAALILERIRVNLILALTGGRVAPFTVSFGLASSVDADTFEEVLAVADRALLAAKAAGRDRVIVATSAVRAAS
jgi:diguanylate cyclase (GGDEF)-like protein